MDFAEWREEVPLFGSIPSGPSGTGRYGSTRLPRAIHLTGSPREAYFAVAERTRELGMSFIGHVPLSVTLAEASDAGQKSFEHVADVWEANPLEDIRNTQRIAAVVLNGRYFDRDALDAMLADVERAAAVGYTGRAGQGSVRRARRG